MQIVILPGLDETDLLLGRFVQLAPAECRVLPLPVFGMLRAFSELEKQREVEASRLAEGIMFALMMGAIPLAIACVAFMVWVWTRKKSQPHAKDV